MILRKVLRTGRKAEEGVGEFGDGGNFGAGGQRCC